MVVAIEPEPENFEVLKKNIALNELKNVIALNLACASKLGKVRLYLSPGPGWHSIVNKTSRSIQVTGRTLDDILAEIRVFKIDLLKIDVEGAEAHVLLGARRTLRNTKKIRIIFEALDEAAFRKCQKILEPLGYRIKYIYPTSYVAER